MLRSDSSGRFKGDQTGNASAGREIGVVARAGSTDPRTAPHWTAADNHGQPCDGHSRTRLPGRGRDACARRLRQPPLDGPIREGGTASDDGRHRTRMVKGEFGGKAQRCMVSWPTTVGRKGVPVDWDRIAGSALTTAKRGLPPRRRLGAGRSGGRVGCPRPGPTRHRRRGPDAGRCTVSH